MLYLARRVRSRVSRLFHHFGIHCATHQKRVILISCVVITSLFYPALALYSSPNPLSDLSSRFFNAYQSDVREIWEDHDALRVRDDAAARARCGMERTLRIERVLIPSSEWTPTGAATPSTVHFALRLDDRMRSVISDDANSALSCVRTQNDQCFVLSPSLFFDHGVPSAAADVLGAINMTPNITVSGIPVSPSMLFSARSTMDGHHHMIERIGFLALTYFFHDHDCLTREGHGKWISTLAMLAPDDQGSTSVAPFVFQKPRFIALQYDPTSSRPSHFSAISLFLYLSYLIIFVSFSGSLRRMDTVHSRFGLMFTGLIEIVASTVTSVSVCALAGFRVTMVPWGILPVIIVFVGAENMFLLVDAVTSTSITLPVKERVGTGLAVAGTSNTLKTVTYNSILGTIAFFSSGAIQQFCSFAIVLLVAHWFLIHTFFIAVLSIDLQRLELSDMLSQDKASKPSVPPVTPKTSNESLPSKRQRTMSRIQQLLHGRAAKNGSLVMMLAVTATLYYITYPFPSHQKDDMDPFPFLRYATAVQRPTNPRETALSPAWDIWNILNPDHDHLVHIRIETPVVVALNPNELPNESQRSKHTKYHNYDSMARRPMKPLWLLKIVILPIGTTTGCLYLLLVYLLKDAELLEAQRSRPDGSSTSATRSVLSIEDGMEFATLPRVFATDVDLIAANEDASVMAIVSTENELFIWNGQYSQVDVFGILPHDQSGSDVGSSITTVAMDSHGRHCAIGTDNGVVAVWQLTSQAVPCDGFSLTVAQSSSVVDMAFTSVKSSSVRGSLAAPNGDVRPRKESIIAVCDHGSATYLPLPGELISRTIRPSRPSDVLRSRILRTSNYYQIYVAFTYVDGTLELCSCSADMDFWETDCVLQAGSPADPVTEICYQIVNCFSTIILATCTRAGAISLWDINQRECIFVLDDAFGDVTHLRIFPIPSQPCQKCGELTPDGLSLAFSVGPTIFVHHACIQSASKRCTCAFVSMLSPREIYGHRSRSGSASSTSSAPIKSRLKPPSVPASASLGTPAFPVSGHGAHTRRTGSEKDTSRRSSESLPVIYPPQGELESSTILPSSRNLWNIPSPSAASNFRELTVHQIASINCERGGWDVVDGGKQLIGLRRRSRLAQDRSPKMARTVSPSTISAMREGLTASVLERWELWAFTPAKPEAGVRASCLLELVPPSRRVVKGSSLYPRLPFTRISPVIVRPSVFVAGLGNTTGVIEFAHRSRPS